jgi:hypothetical protein
MKYIRLYDTFKLIKEQQTQIYRRPKDQYEYKVEDDNWLSRRKGTDKWFNITGGDFKPVYQKSIDLLDKEFPKARTEKAPKRGGESKPEKAPKEVEYTRDNGQTAKGTIVDVDKEKETVTIKSNSGKEFQKPYDKVDVPTEELKKISDTPPPAQDNKEEETPKENTNKIPAELKGFVLASDDVKKYIKQKSTISEEGTTYVYPSTNLTDLKAGYVYVSGYFVDPKQVKIMWVGTQKEEGDFEGESEFQDGLNSAVDLKEAYDREQVVKKNKQRRQQTQTGQVDQEARAKSRAYDETEDNLTDNLTR